MYTAIERRGTFVTDPGGGRSRPRGGQESVRHPRIPLQRDPRRDQEHPDQERE